MGTQLPPLLWAGTHGHLGQGWPSYLKIRSLICSSKGLWGDKPETLELGTTTITTTTTIVMTEQEGGAWVRLTSYTECFRKRLGTISGEQCFQLPARRRQRKLLFHFVSSRVASWVPEQSWEGKRTPRWGSLLGRQAPFPLALLSDPMTLGRSFTLFASRTPSIEREVLADGRMAG